MSEPTAEHLKAAQEWLEQHGGPLEGSVASQSYGWVEVSDENVSALAALLASREQALREENERLRKRTSNLLACKNCEERAEASEARVRELEQMLEQAVDTGAGLMLDQMERAVTEGGKFSDERANRFVAAEARLLIFECWCRDNPDQWIMRKDALNLCYSTEPRCPHEARLKRVVEICQASMEKCRAGVGWGTVYAHEIVAAVQSSEEGR